MVSHIIKTSRQDSFYYLSGTLFDLNNETYRQGYIFVGFPASITIRNQLNKNLNRIFVNISETMRTINMLHTSLEVSF